MYKKKTKKTRRHVMEVSFENRIKVEMKLKMKIIRNSN